MHDGNLTMEDIVQIAAVMRPRSCARYFAGTCTEILGTCLSIGCTVEGQDPRVITQKIKSGEIPIDEPSEE